MRPSNERIRNAAMPAGVFAGVGRLAIEERSIPKIRASTDVLLEVEACGICGTDLQILSTPPGHPATVGVILGHEIVGKVASAGEHVRGVAPGQRVVVAPNVSCGQCIWCRRGIRNQCEHFTTYGIFDDGGLAPYVCVPAATCNPISSRVSTEIAALAEPLSTVAHGVKRADPFPGETAVVIGAGPVGLMFTALLKLAGASVIAIETVDQRAELVARLGASEVIDPRFTDAAAVVHELTEGLGADLVVDAVGTQLATALACVRKAGRIVLFGINENFRTEVAQHRITRGELSILGAYVGQDILPLAIDLLEQGRLDLEPMVTHRIGIEELPGAVDEMRAGRAVKIQVQFA